MKLFIFSLASLLFLFLSHQAKAVQQPLDVKVYVGAGGGFIQAAPVLFLAQKMPEKIKLSFRYGGDFPNGSPEDKIRWRKGMLQVLYVQKNYPEKFTDYVLCRAFDPPDRACWSLMGIDFSKYDSELKTLNAEFLSQVAQAKKEGIDPEDLPTAFVNGKRYRGALYYASFLSYVNGHLPKDQQIANVPAAQSVKLYAIANNDDKVGQRDLKFEKQLFTSYPSLEIISLSSSSEEGKALLKKSGAVTLPAYVFDQALQENKMAQSAFSPRKDAKSSNGHLILDYSQGSRVLLDRAKENNELTLFVMSQCPFGVKAENAILKMMKENKVPTGFKMKLRYIISKNKNDRTWDSLHGQAELDENKRQIVIQEYFYDKLPAYLEARNKDYQSENWQAAAAAAGIKPQEIEKRLPKAEKILEQDHALTEKLGIRASPTFLWENQALLSSHEDLAKILGFDIFKVAVQ